MSEADSTNTNAAINSASLTRAQENAMPKIRHIRQSDRIANSLLFASGIVALGSIVIKGKQGLSLAEKSFRFFADGESWGQQDYTFVEHSLFEKGTGALMLFISGSVISEFTRQVLRKKENEQVTSHTR